MLRVRGYWVRKVIDKLKNWGKMNRYSDNIMIKTLISMIYFTRKTLSTLKRLFGDKGFRSIVYMRKFLRRIAFNRPRHLRVCIAIQLSLMVVKIILRGKRTLKFFHMDAQLVRRYWHLESIFLMLQLLELILINIV